MNLNSINITQWLIKKKKVFLNKSKIAKNQNAKLFEFYILLERSLHLPNFSKPNLKPYLFQLKHHERTRQDHH